ncbi:MAG: uroporphyrinogen-III C-methyltransferase [Pseudomonadota bacterium]
MSENEHNAEEANSIDNDEPVQADAQSAESDATFDDVPPPKGKSRFGLILIGLVLFGAVGAGAWFTQDKWLGQIPFLAKDDAVDTAPDRAAQTDSSDPTQATEPAADRDNAGATQAASPSATSSTRNRLPPTEDLIPAATVADIDALRAEIQTLRNAIDSTNNNVSAVEDSVSLQANDTRSLKSSIDARVDLLDSLPGRVRSAEEALVRLQGISAGSRASWLISEAQYYMQIANAQLQLANNPQLARTALQLADQRVRELADPAYTPVRRQLANEIAALSGLDRADIEGVTLLIGTLGEQVVKLPLDRDIVPKQTVATRDASETGWTRVKSVFGNAASGLFRVRRADEDAEVLLSPEAEYFLRLNVQLQLQAARLSLLLGDNAGYKQSLGDARSWVSEYFDNDARAVTDMLTQIDSIADAQRNETRPDISGSLTLLRQQRDISEFGQPVIPGSDAPGPDAEPDADTGDAT